MAKAQVISYEYVCDMSGVKLSADEVEHRTLTTPKGFKVALDLCPSQAEAFDAAVVDFETASEVLAVFAAKGSRAKSVRPRQVVPGQPGATATSVVKAVTDAARAEQVRTFDPAQVRAWALANGVAGVGRRGRVPAEVVAAWRKATG